MAHDSTRPDAVPQHASSSARVRSTTTLVVTGPVAVTGDLLWCDDGEFHTVTVSSADDTVQVVLAGDRHGLTDIFSAALQAIPDDVEEGGL